MKSAPQRMWINQPSTQQPLHRRHGENVLAVHEYDDTWLVFFLSGEITSMQVSRLWLSEGWKPQSESETDAVQAVADARFCLDNPDVLHTPAESRRIIGDLLKNISRGDDRRHYICVCPDCKRQTESEKDRGYRQEIDKLMEESQKFFKLKNNYLHALIAANRTIEEARQCFTAALTEGWPEAMEDTTDERIKDLWARRIKFAAEALYDHTDFFAVDKDLQARENAELLTAGLSPSMNGTFVGRPGLDGAVAGQVKYYGAGPILVFRKLKSFDSLAAFYEFQTKFRKDGVL